MTRNSTPKQSANKLTRLNFPMDEKTRLLLAELSEKKHASKTEVLRRALQTYAYLCDEMEQQKHAEILVGKKSLLVP